MRGSYGPFVKFSAVVFIAAGAFAGWTLVKGEKLIVTLAERSGAEVAATGPAEATPAAPVTPPLVAGAPPVAARKDHTVTTSFGASRVDPYYWLKDKENPEVLSYLNAENDYALAQLAPLKPVQDQIRSELEARANLADVEAPYAADGYYYQTRYEQGADYPIIVRRKGSPDAAEEIILNVPELATGHAQYFLRNWVVNPAGTEVAFAVDFSGDRRHEIFVRNLATGAVTPTGIKDSDAAIVWSAAGDAILYGSIDATYRTNRIMRHAMSGAVADTVLLEEPDTTLSLGVGAARSKAFAIITVYHLQRTELLAVSLSDPNAQPIMLLPRSRNARALADHLDGRFYILTNEGAPDQKIVSVPDTDPMAAPQTVVAEVKGHFLDNFVLFNGRVAVQEIHDAMQTVRVVDLATGASREMSPAVIGETTLDRNEDPSLPTLRLTFETPTAPAIVYDLDLATGAATEMKRSTAWTWFKPDLYESQRIMASAKDGTQVPVTLIWRKDQKKPEGNPTLMYGYGAYGVSSMPGIGFYLPYVSLVDRGFVLAIAHVRGGREMGDAWYQQGRMANKMNSFTDFVSATEAVIAQGFARPGKVYAFGRSAGGLLMGAVTNIGGNLYDGIVAGVPFVDVLTTMLDDTIPLTTFEYEEWGNPNIPEQYDWMKAYSPYDNLTAKAYPALYVFTALNDSQVGFFEPAKWVAKLRTMKTDQNPILFVINMGAGHSGNSGRTGRVEDYTRMFSWLVDRAAK